MLRAAALFLLRRLDLPSVAAAQREMATTPAGVLDLFGRLAYTLRPKPHATRQQDGNGQPPDPPTGTTPTRPATSPIKPRAGP